MNKFLEFWKYTWKSAFYKDYTDDFESLLSTMLLAAAGWGIGLFVYLVYSVLSNFGS